MPRIGYFVVAIIAAQLSISGSAAPLLSISLVGRVSGTGDPFASVVTTSAPGQGIDYRIVFDMAPVGTQNTQGMNTRTINSLTPGTDGANFAKVDVVQISAAAGLQVDLVDSVTLNSAWDDSVAASQGIPVLRTATDHDLHSIRPGRSIGTFSAIDPEVVANGQFYISSLGDGTNAVISARFAADSPSGSVRFNAQAAVFMTTLTEDGDDPLITYIPLVVGIPEPTSVCSVTLLTLLVLSPSRLKRSSATSAAPVPPIRFIEPLSSLFPSDLGIYASLCAHPS